MRTREHRVMTLLPQGSWVRSFDRSSKVNQPFLSFGLLTRIQPGLLSIGYRLLIGCYEPYTGSHDSRDTETSHCQKWKKKLIMREMVTCARRSYNYYSRGYWNLIGTNCVPPGYKYVNLNCDGVFGSKWMSQMLICSLSKLHHKEHCLSSLLKINVQW